MPDIKVVRYFLFPQELLNLWVAVGDDVINSHALGVQQLQASYKSFFLHVVTPANLIAL